MTTTITVLRTLGPLLAKAWQADGTIADYDNARQFTVSQADVADIDELHDLLNKLQHDARRCILRGQPCSDTPADDYTVTLRTLDDFEDRPSKLFMIDVDNFESLLYGPGEAEPPDLIAEYVASLPKCFHDVSYVWQLSGSCGHPSKAGLRAHLWFLLAEPLTCAQAEAWSKQHLGELADPTVHRTVQVNYTAAPLMRRGAPEDPHTGSRLGLVRGLLGDDVQIPAELPVPAVEARQGRGGRSHHIDPREKPGVIGALCRAFHPAEIVSLFPDHFSSGDRPHRITWLQGGGSAEGIGVTGDELGLFNTHATSPIGSRSANLFDFVRAHCFIHYDKDIDPDAIDLDPTFAPSYQKTREWALALSEVQAELTAETPEAVQEETQRVEAAQVKKSEVALANEESASSRMDNLKKLIERCDSLTKLEHQIGQRIRDASFSDTEREIIATLLRQRTAAFTPDGKPLSISTVRKWVQPAAVNPSQAFPNLTRDGSAPLLTRANLEVLLGRLGYTIRYDMIRKRQEILGPGLDFARDNYDNATFAELMSECGVAGLPQHAGNLKLLVCLLASRNNYNPVLEWIESEPWDGVSRFADVAATLTLAPDFEPGLAQLIVRKWMIQAVAAAASPVPLQTRGVLTLQGAEYRGKSRWVKSLLPGHEDLAVLGRQIDPHNKDDVKIATSHWICELGELDGTFSKADRAALKAFLANPEDSFRLPYATTESKWPRRTVFVATVNAEETLADDGGNTRYWMIPIVDVNTAHGINMQQVWAEALQCWGNGDGEKHFFEREEMELIKVANQRFTIPSTWVDRLARTFAWDAAKRGDPDVRWVERTTVQIAELCSMTNPTDTDIQKIGIAMRKLSTKRSRSDGHVRWQSVPMLRHQVELEEQEA